MPFRESPLFREYEGLLAPDDLVVEPEALSEDDVLLVIDMQADFVSCLTACD